MNHPPDNERLLDDVLAGAAPGDFRGAVLVQTLKLARRRRQFRHGGQAALLLVAGVLLAGLVWQHSTKLSGPLPSVAGKTTPPSYKLVRTEPLPASDIVTTRPFQADAALASSAGAVEVTTVGGGYRQIDDAELLQMVAKPAVLVRTGPHSEELVFADPADRKQFPAN